ncbi:hypothetical protein HYDPIDRAFT_126943 [Hydnomerulius pinastri MD-312]|nr:hypothetical protein HYDPIDRAFT_126943 [Hydnomerulius pinastri MD-312]
MADTELAVHSVESVIANPSTTAPPAQAPPDNGPIPLSFPAILRNSNLPDRFAHLRQPLQDRASANQAQARKSKQDRADHEGKRWVRRRENAKFTHNPHITPPTKSDLSHPLQAPSTTFPTPLPTYLPRTVPVPPSLIPQRDPATSSAGLFSLSLRGARRTLRARPSSAPLIQAVELHLADWLEGGTYLNPDQGKGVLSFPGEPIKGREDIREVGREAGRLVWAVRVGVGADSTPLGDGGFERYVVHCVARWYGVVSFSTCLFVCRCSIFISCTDPRPPSPLSFSRHKRQGNRRPPSNLPPPPKHHPPRSPVHTLIPHTRHTTNNRRLRFSRLRCQHVRFQHHRRIRRGI